MTPKASGNRSREASPWRKKLNALASENHDYSSVDAYNQKNANSSQKNDQIESSAEDNLEPSNEQDESVIAENNGAKKRIDKDELFGAEEDIEERIGTEATRSDASLIDQALEEATRKNEFAEIQNDFVDSQKQVPQSDAYQELLSNHDQDLQTDQVQTAQNYANPAIHNLVDQGVDYQHSNGSRFELDANLGQRVHNDALQETSDTTNTGAIYLDQEADGSNQVDQSHHQDAAAESDLQILNQEKDILVFDEADFSGQDNHFAAEVNDDSDQFATEINFNREVQEDAQQDPLAEDMLQLTTLADEIPQQDTSLKETQRDASFADEVTASTVNVQQDAGFSIKVEQHIVSPQEEQSKCYQEELLVDNQNALEESTASLLDGMVSDSQANSAVDREFASSESKTSTYPSDSAAIQSVFSADTDSTSAPHDENKPRMSGKQEVAAHASGTLKGVENCCGECGGNLSREDPRTIYKQTAYHPRCFTCYECKSEKLSGLNGFYVSGGLRYCVDCYNKNVAERCTSCGEAILEGGVRHRARPFHHRCFKCAGCDTVLGKTPFVWRENRTLCLPCYAEKFAEKCTKCTATIQPGEQYLQVEGKRYHDNCLVCDICEDQLQDHPFVQDRDRNVCVSCSTNGFQSHKQKDGASSDPSGSQSAPPADSKTDSKTEGGDSSGMDLKDWMSKPSGGGLESNKNSIVVAGLENNKDRVMVAGSTNAESPDTQSQDAVLLSAQNNENGVLGQEE